jgi:hypothetical protein
MARQLTLSITLKLTEKRPSLLLHRTRRFVPMTITPFGSLFVNNNSSHQQLQ